MSELAEKSNTFRPELALPAGSLQCALYAFKGGADAVYFGLKDFSARKGAVNFTFEDARKLKEICKAQGKKFYVTLNTLLYDNELPHAYTLLKQLTFLQPDGLIVQDLGIAKIIKENFPNLELHGSTQLAVHTIQGVKELQDLGFTRVVLSRELSFDEIKKIRQACPDIELKVFIHGALCYGFSGLCMASQVITGRSANRGACAQICRTWFTNPKETSKESAKENSCTSSWLFSMKDLCLGELIKKYAQLGIDSLKVEGRMKGPEYVYWCAKYYSLLLDGQDENSEEVKWAKECMQTSFSRETTLGFFNTKESGSCNAENMVCSTYSSHKGIQVGTIEKVLSSKAIIRFSKPVALRDGLLVVSQGEKSMESSGFGLSFIEGGRSFISEGETATVNFPTSSFTKKPSFGTPVYCTSRHNQNLPLLSESLPLYKKPVDLTIYLKPNSIEINGLSFGCPMQQANSPIDLNSNFAKTFQASDKSYFTAGKIELTNQSGFSAPFIPLSVLKQIRREFYAKLDASFEANLQESQNIQESPKLEQNQNSQALPKRSSLGLWDSITQINGAKYLPLCPLMFKEEQYFEKLNEIVAKEPEVIIGLNNVAQIRWAKQHPDAYTFADVFLYTANTVAYEALKEELPNLVGSYKLNKNVDEAFKLPLFISRVCMRHNGLGQSCKGCTRDNTYHITQNDKHYKVLCKDCITVMQEE